MLLNKKYTFKELRENLEKFIDMYGKYISDGLKLYLYCYLERGLSEECVSDLLEQFYCEFDLIDKSKSYHYIFNNFMNEVYKDINDKKIIEVGGGTIPTLGRIMASKSNKEIIVYDKNLAVSNNNYENLILKDEEFTKDTNIEEADLIVGLLPCEASKDIVTSACENNKEFILQFCDCSTNSDSFVSPDLYIRNLIFYANELCKKNGLELYSTNIYEYFSQPLIYSKKMK